MLTFSWAPSGSGPSFHAEEPVEDGRARSAATTASQPIAVALRAHDGAPARRRRSPPPPGRPRARRRHRAPPARRSTPPCRRPARPSPPCRCRSRGRGSSGSGAGRGRGRSRTCRSARRSSRSRARGRRRTPPRPPRPAGARRTPPSVSSSPSRARSSSRPAKRSSSDGKITSASRAVRAWKACHATKASSPPGDAEQRCAGARRVGRVDEQPVVRARHRRVARDPAPPRLERQPELAHELAGQEADQVRVARQPGVDAGERRLRHRGAAHLVAPLEHEDGAPGPRQVGRGDEPVVAAADDDDVVTAPHAAAVAGTPRKRIASIARSSTAVRPGSRAARARSPSPAPRCRARRAPSRRADAPRRSARRARASRSRRRCRRAACRRARRGPPPRPSARPGTMPSRTPWVPSARATPSALRRSGSG